MVVKKVATVIHSALIMAIAVQTSVPFAFIQTYPIQRAKVNIILVDASL